MVTIGDFILETGGFTLLPPDSTINQSMDHTIIDIPVEEPEWDDSEFAAKTHIKHLKTD